MIVPYIPLIFVMIFVLAAQHDRCRNQIRSGMTVAWSEHCAARTSRENRKPAAPAHVAKRAAPEASQPPRAKAVGVEPSADAATLRQVTAATAVAARLTAVASAQGSRNKPGPLVVLVMARPDITAISDLAGKDIAIDDRTSVSRDNVRDAIAGAGASDVKLGGGRTKAITRLMRKKVPAAVLAVVSPDAAEGFPEIAGFKIFRIPLPPR